MMIVLRGSFLVALFAAASALHLAEVYSPQELAAIDHSLAEDAVFNFTQLAKKYGYPVEEHEALTTDGYYLTLHRIPYGKACGPGKRKIPVLVLHGLFCSSDDYIVMGPGKALGYILADECYDVWMGNNRGNKYSRKHLKMNVKDPNFWKFTWHEMGSHDLPAMVDYILDATGQPALHYIGHSQGTTQFFIFGSLRPEYHRKIRSAHALSPVAFMKNIKSPTFKILSIFHKPIQQLATLVGLHEFMPSCQFLNMIGMQVCKEEYPALQAICKNVLFLIAGSRGALLNATMLPVIIGHTPAGAATGQLVHYAQGILKDGFKQFDHGTLGNILKYGSATPPEYNMHNISIPVALYYSNNDMLSDVIDVERLQKILPNVIGKYRVPNNLFSHIDYLWAADVKTLIYDQLLNILKRY